MQFLNQLFDIDTAVSLKLTNLQNLRGRYPLTFNDAIAQKGPGEEATKIPSVTLGTNQGGDISDNDPWAELELPDFLDRRCHKSRGREASIMSASGA